MCFGKGQDLVSIKYGDGSVWIKKYSFSAQVPLNLVGILIVNLQRQKEEINFTEF